MVEPQRYERITAGGVEKADAPQLVHLPAGHGPLVQFAVTVYPDHIGNSIKCLFPFPLFF